ncbi:MAG: hypothetical protein U0V70_02245 [Terriglobia bacterium]
MPFAALYELDRYVKNGLTEEQFERTRTFLISYSKLWAATLDRRLGYQMDSEFYGTEYYLDRIEKELKKLNVAEVNRAVRKYISPTNLKIAVVADQADELMKALQSNQPSPIHYAAPVPASITQADKAIEVLPLAINPGQSHVVPVDRLFE